MDAEAVLQIRSFNRTVAERIGAVSDRFLHQRRPLNEARLISEIGLEGEGLRTLRPIGLYRGAGYANVEALNTEPHAHYWFEKRLEGSARFPSKKTLTKLAVQTTTKM